MSALSIGVSALQVSQKLLQLTGQNVANADTPGYHVQVASLAGIESGDNIGAGVTITGIARQISGPIETALLNNTYESQDTTAQLNNLQQVQAYLAPGSGGIDTQLSSFFNDVQQLSAEPDSQAQRSVVLNDAVNLASGINSASNQLQATGSTIDATLGNVVGQINQDAQQIASLNGQIETATVGGQQPNDLLDQRDELISQLSQLIDVRVIPTGSNDVTVLAAGAPIVAGTQSLALQYQVGANNQGELLRADQSAQGPNPTGGQIAGLLQVRNGDLPQITSQLNSLTQALIQGVDEAQATGIALTGPLTSATGTRGVTETTVPLSQAGLAFPPSAGTLAISAHPNDGGQCRNAHALPGTSRPGDRKPRSSRGRHQRPGT